MKTLLPRFTVGHDNVWITNDSSQSRSLLEEEQVYWFPHSPPKDVKGMARNALDARQVLDEVRPDYVISTGSSLALAVLPVAARRGIPCHYIESATRVSAPSLSGRLLAHVRRVRTYTQYPALANRRWNYRGSVFDQFTPVAPAQQDRRVARVVVTVGTSREYGFRRLVDAVLAVSRPDWTVFWQTGSTDVEDLSILAASSVTAGQLRSEIRSADVVISHAGTGSAVTALECGKRPILVPRDPSFGEHVDDHQEQIAAELSRRNLAVVTPISGLSSQLVDQAVGWSIKEQPEPPPFLLD